MRHHQPTRLLQLLVVALAIGIASACGDAAADPAAVRIWGPGCQTDVVGQGIAVDDVILTSGHVVDGVIDVVVTTAAGDRNARVVHIDRELDVAVLIESDSADGSAAVQDLLDRSRELFVTPQAGDTGMVLLRDAEGDVTAEPYEVVRRITANTENVGLTETVSRPTLELDSDIDEGDSGAFLRAEDGSFAGAIWAVSRNRPEVAYAVQGDELIRTLRAAVENPSGPGPC